MKETRRARVLMKITSPRGKVLTILDTKPEEVSNNFYDYTTDLRCKYISTWMDRERMVTDERIRT